MAVLEGLPGGFSEEVSEVNF
eukprot:SAG11_NODE_10631_length_815_cov_20.421788_1_plen_20_part_01